ncbi:MAG: LysM peptidoglycan-binding domain-containing M23 family metallopeptidase [Spirochaetales bacterium]|jgi:murein DD-endopeptidase MepM/ murein hydrolase activator NlpD|nr:LysM peptidoglycan-binding domain-containing M23 family metallopeptidase [Spirochaetales bacterium]
MFGPTRFLAACILLCVPFLCIAEDITHIVRDGETLYSIARRYGTSAETLMRVNKIEDPGKLRPGTRLILPDMYEVQKGDTLYGIARRFNCDVPVLLTLNNITPDSLIKPGELLSVPRTSASATASARPPAESPLPQETRGVPAADENTFWPHPGVKKSLDGKLTGLSFEGKPGDEVLAVASGKVVWVGPYRGFGKVVFVQSGQGYIYVYAGNDDILVSFGDTIRKGQKVATMGINPYEGKASLSFIVYKDGKPVRPEEAPRI